MLNNSHDYRILILRVKECSGDTSQEENLGKMTAKSLLAVLNRKNLNNDMTGRKVFAFFLFSAVFLMNIESTQASSPREYEDPNVKDPYSYQKYQDLRLTQMASLNQSTYPFSSPTAIPANKRTRLSVTTSPTTSPQPTASDTFVRVYTLLLNSTSPTIPKQPTSLTKKTTISQPPISTTASPPTFITASPSVSPQPIAATQHPMHPTASPTISPLPTTEMPLPSPTKMPFSSPSYMPSTSPTNVSISAQTRNTISPTVSPSVAKSRQPATDRPIINESSAPTILLNKLQSGQTNATTSGTLSETSSHYINLKVPIIIIVVVLSVGALAFYAYSQTSKERVPTSIGGGTVSENYGNRVLQRVKVSKEEKSTHLNPLEDKDVEKVGSIPALTKKANSYELHVSAIDSGDLSTLYDTASQKADASYFGKSRSGDDTETETETVECAYGSLWENIFGGSDISSYATDNFFLRH